MAATHDGGGYWLVASDGGIFSYGDAHFHGSAGSLPLNAPIVGMAATPDGGGYWLVARDGGVFTYGNAVFAGSAGGLVLDAPVTGMASTPNGGGYWLVAPTAGVFTYGDAPYLGSLGGTALPGPVVGLAGAAGGLGYWLAVGSEPLAGKVVGIDPGHDGLNGSAPAVIDQPVFNGTGVRALRHDGHGDRQRLHRGAVQLQRRHRPGGRPAGGGGHGRADPRPNNDGVGPCVTTRAAIINDAHADVAVDIHADGGPADGRGFAVLEPMADGPNDGVIASSAAFAATLRDRVCRRHAHAGEHLRRGRRSPAAERPRRAEPDHGAQGADRVRQHAERDRRRAPRHAHLPAGRGGGHGPGHHGVPDRDGGLTQAGPPRGARTSVV